MSKPAPFIWYELMTTDPDSAAAFYGEVVGWKVTGHSDLGAGGGVDYRMIGRDDGGNAGGILGLSPEMIEGGARPCWLGYLHTADVDATVAGIEGDGGKVIMPANDLPVGRIAMVADPGGAPFYVMTPEPPEGAEGVSSAFQAPKNPGHCGWNELMAADPARETRFYTERFGWTLPEPMDMGEYGKYQFVAADGVTVGAIMGLMPGSPAPMWNHYFWVPSIAKAKAAIESGGGTVVNGPMEVPGGDWIVQGLDPQGAMFSLVGGADRWPTIPST